MRSRSLRPWLVALALLGGALAGCGGDDGDEATPPGLSDTGARDDGDGVGADNACRLVDLAGLEAALGVAFDRSTAVGAGCTFVDDGGTAVQFSRAPLPAGVTAEAAMATSRAACDDGSEVDLADVAEGATASLGCLVGGAPVVAVVLDDQLGILTTGAPPAEGAAADAVAALADLLTGALRAA